MSLTERTVNAPLEKVFEVLADGWSYANWVVGTAHIRDVDTDWPAAGSKLHHTVGIWPLTRNHETEVLDCQAPIRLTMKPKLWPLGELTAVFTLRKTSPGTTRVALAEEFSDGPARAIRNKINDVLMHARNREALRRLADLAEHRP
ncbi:polyketide cyclase [Catellatospora sp. TT07R-123]|uniref:SRPBCC family protein n=1 Tax=Catellatospora sp. TT07R-123 TaxID=2733863 RepID=UPI001B0415EB|nr:SRPBCC family protein [Catellatospora sp. TT07R-123]GHJ47390.1 polyketide cyclase [Catellatospora sp. TT07R-123]